MNYFHEKPVTKVILSNIKYGRQLENYSQAPVVLYSTYFENQGSTPQTATRAIAFTKSTSNSIGGAAGIEMGITVEMEGGIPLIFSSKTTVSLSASLSVNWGKVTTDGETDTISAATTIPPR